MRQGDFRAFLFWSGRAFKAIAAGGRQAPEIYQILVIQTIFGNKSRKRKPGKYSRKGKKNFYFFLKKLLTNQETYDIIDTERGENKSPEKERLNT